MIPGVSISYQTALSTSILRLPAHPASALTIHAREIQALWSHNHDTGSYDTLYQVDYCSSDVVIYWTMTGTHVVPDKTVVWWVHTNYILPGSNTTAVLNIQLLYGILYTTSRPSTNTSPITLCKLPELLLVWTACDTPSIEVDTTEQQVARHNQPNI